MSQPLDDVDLSKSLSTEESLQRIGRAQRHLTHLRLFTAGLLDASSPGPPVIVIFEGFDAAGKGGAIRRVTAALDPRHVRVVPISTPTAEEAAHHFLWRFMSTLPPRGGMTIYDRSWYGRLLVERVEKLIDNDTAKRSSAEICEFERAIVDDGAIIVKFWMHISAEEQLARFLKRQDDPLKHWKLTGEDWENRTKREAYVHAVNDMLAATDHDRSHWHVVAAEDKKYARVKVLESLNRAIERGLASLGLEVPPSRGDDYLGG